MIRYRNKNYRRAALPSQPHFKGNGVKFWIYAVVAARMPESLPVKGKQIRSIPKAITKDVTLEEKAAITEAIDKGEPPVWYFHLEGRGWNWREKGGAKDVDLVHQVLQWLLKFESQETVNGAKLLYCEINNKQV